MREYKFIATTADSAFTGIGIVAIDAQEDRVSFQRVYRSDGVEKRSRLQHSLLRYDRDGNAYFMHHEEKWYLSEFLRIQEAG